MRAFISGHLNLTPEQFELWYVPAILRAIDAGHGFVVGEAPGADTMAQQFLFDNGVKDVLIVWNYPYRYARNLKNFDWGTYRVGRKPHEKDAFMTSLSDYDIAVSFRKGSGTQANLYRRAKK